MIDKQKYNKYIMKRLYVILLKVFTLLILIFSYSNVNAERKIRFAPLVVDSFSITVQNLVQTANNKLEFDVFMADDDGDLDTFELASFQFGFLINSSIYAGGTLSVTIDNSTSTLNQVQKVTAAPNATTTIGNQTVIKLVSGIVTPGQGTILATVSPGTLITHFIVTSSVPFPANSKPDLTFTSSTATNPLYATRVAEFINNSSTQLDINNHEYVNATVIGNPVLNQPIASQTVTGSGFYCHNGGGLPIGLSNSEVGVTYTLKIGTTSFNPSVVGTGSAISFGNHLAGTYTVQGSYVNGTTVWGTTTMMGSAEITEMPNLTANVSIRGDANVCLGTPVTFIATPVNGGTSPIYQWYNGTVAVGTNSSIYSYNPVNGDVIKVVMTSNATPCLVGSPVTSNKITMTVNPTISTGVSIQADVNPATKGKNVTFTATPVGGGTLPYYQWFVNNIQVGTNYYSPIFIYAPTNNDKVYVLMSSNASPCLVGSPATSNTVTMSVITTGIDDTKQVTIYTYSQNKNIFVNCSEKAKQIQVYNTLGSLIYETNNVEGLKKIDMNSQPIAYYFVKIVTSDNVFTKKVLLQ